MRLLLIASVLAWMLLAAGCQPGDPYYDRASDITDEASRRVQILMEDAFADSEDCGRSIFSTAACDRAIDKLDEVRGVLSHVRADMLALDPPPEARLWHDRYLQFVNDASGTIGHAVNAYYDLDVDSFIANLGRFEELAKTEDELVREFRELQE